VEKLDKYRQIVREVVRRHSQRRMSVEGIEVYAVEDVPGDHYQVIRNGWANNRWYYGVILHIDIRDGKVWIQHDGIEDGVAMELVEMGIPREDIVLGFQEPFARQFTEFAVR
jgi:hypothetical protein